MHLCPNCNGKLPLRKFFLVNNFKSVRCPHCGARLVPDKKTNSLIGGIAGFSTALTVGLATVVYYLLGEMYGTLIVLITCLLVIMIYLASVLITRNVVDFKTKNFSNEKN